jgi:hypothetical protein
MAMTQNPQLRSSFNEVADIHTEPRAAEDRNSDDLWDAKPM